MDHLLDRIPTLESHVQSLQQQTTSVARRLRWWRRLACSLAVLTVFGLPLTLGAGHEDDKALRSLAQRIRALERKLKHVMSGHNGSRAPGTRHHRSESAHCQRPGDHRFHEWTRQPDRGLQRAAPMGRRCRRAHTILWVGSSTISLDSGGWSSSASSEIMAWLPRSAGVVRTSPVAILPSISGGVGDVAEGCGSAVSGGQGNSSRGVLCLSERRRSQYRHRRGFVSKRRLVQHVEQPRGLDQRGLKTPLTVRAPRLAGDSLSSAAGVSSSISGGFQNTARGTASSVSGGESNTASGDQSSVSGGRDKNSLEAFHWRAGDLFQEGNLP